MVVNNADEATKRVLTMNLVQELTGKWLEAPVNKRHKVVVNKIFFTSGT